MSDTETTISPALTPEESEQLRKGCAIANVAVPADPVYAHKTAAVCLYGQPFGFTQEDVEMLRAIEVVQLRTMIRGTDFVPQRIASLADRLAALLPAPR